jgi:hypothetical protein
MSEEQLTHLLHALTCQLGQLLHDTQMLVGVLWKSPTFDHQWTRTIVLSSEIAGAVLDPIQIWY